MNLFEKKALETIYEFSGNLDWYRLDRRLSRTIDMDAKIVEVVERLIKKGFVKKVFNSKIEREAYAITEEGKKFVNPQLN